MLDLTLLNRFGVATFERGEYRSILDLAFATSDLVLRGTKWQLLEEELLSDHRGIWLQVKNHTQTPSRKSGVGQCVGWTFRHEQKEALLQGIRENFMDGSAHQPEELVANLTRACSAVLKPKSSKAGKMAVYWWTDEVATQRRACIKARRALTRAKMPREVLVETYKAEKNKLKKVIIIAKTRSWKQLIKESDENIWGNAYKVVTGKLARKRGEIPLERVEQITNALFPVHDEPPREDLSGTKPHEPLTLGELKDAMDRLKTRKSAGPDGLGTEIIKVAYEAIPSVILDQFNDILDSGIFPTIWKRARLVLIEKPNKDLQDPTAYRPICILDTLSKVLEQVILKRLNTELGEKHAISPRQHGFREGHSTLDAIREVTQRAADAANRPKTTRMIPCLVTFDIRNAFNSASWEIIIKTLQKIGISEYLRKILQSYLQDREILVRAEDRVKTLRITSGVPQGSVLGPTLWNILYNEILELELPEGATTVAYADDLALIVVAKRSDELQDKLQLALDTILQGFNDLRLQIAPEKTELLILAGRRKIEDPTVHVMDTPLRRGTTVKYLGLVLDCNRSFNPHITYVAQRAAKIGNQLARILPNCGGPRYTKRRLLASVVTSTILYGVEIWSGAFVKKRTRLVLERCQRKIALRIIAAYRTVSTEAALVLSSCPPLHLLALEREKTQRSLPPAEARQKTIRLWQGEWVRAPTAGWTRSLIPDVTTWINRQHGEVDYYLSQFFTGHGKFGSYLARFRLREDPSCKYCGSVDTPQHTFFVCERWEDYRRTCFETTGTLTSRNIVAKMIRSRSTWCAVQRFVGDVLKRKSREDKEEESGTE